MGIYFILQSTFLMYFLVVFIMLSKVMPLSKTTVLPAASAVWLEWFQLNDKNSVNCIYLNVARRKVL